MRLDPIRTLTTSILDAILGSETRPKSIKTEVQQTSKKKDRLLEPSVYDFGRILASRTSPKMEPKIDKKRKISMQTDLLALLGIQRSSEP